ncbi:MAG: DUF6438 domain-containing protein [Rhizomicrobium sp.]
MRSLIILFLFSFTVAASAQEAASNSQGGQPQIRAEFPQIHDWNTLKISLQRTMCLGTCPAYGVDIHGDGSVVYNGHAYVAVSGIHKTKISEDAVRQLFAAFQKANFFSLLDSYAASITDFPSYAVTISFEGRNKRVIDYAGHAVGMPAGVSELEEQIDLVAGTKKWVIGDAETLPALVKEGWNFRATNDANFALIESAAQRGNRDLLLAFLHEGVSAKSLYGCNALKESARKDDAAVALALIKADAPVHLENQAGQVSCDALHAAAEWGDPVIVAAVLSEHPDVNLQDRNGLTPLMAAARNDTPRSDERTQDYGKTVELLVNAGANVNAENAKGETALTLAHTSGALVRALLRAGVKNIEAPDWQGSTPLMNSESPDVTLALLQAGANPYLKNKNGKTALDLAEENFWQKTAPILKEWMTAHPQ